MLYVGLRVNESASQSASTRVRPEACPTQRQAPRSHVSLTQKGMLQKKRDWYLGLGRLTLDVTTVLLSFTWVAICNFLATTPKSCEIWTRSLFWVGNRSRRCYSTRRTPLKVNHVFSEAQLEIAVKVVTARLWTFDYSIYFRSDMVRVEPQATTLRNMHLCKGGVDQCHFLSYDFKVLF